MLKVALATNNAVVADGANITVAGLRVTVTSLSGYSALHTGNISRKELKSSAPPEVVL